VLAAAGTSAQLDAAKAELSVLRDTKMLRGDADAVRRVSPVPVCFASPVNHESAKLPRCGHHDVLQIPGTCWSQAVGCLTAAGKGDAVGAMSPCAVRVACSSVGRVLWSRCQADAGGEEALLHIGSGPLAVTPDSPPGQVGHQQLTCAAASARAALEKQAQAEKSAADAKKRAAEALAGRADAQRALDNVAKCVGFRVQGLGPVHSERSTVLPSCVHVIICSVHQRSPELG
jgi:hypothetical protein